MTSTSEQSAAGITAAARPSPGASLTTIKKITAIRHGRINGIIVRAVKIIDAIRK